MFKRSIGSVVFLLVIVLILVLLPVLRGGGVAPTPAIFAEKLTLAEAEARAAEDGRLTLVFATADWCGPCQAFKRSALEDEAVAAWIEERTVPTLLDVTSPRGEAAGDAQRMAISSIPVVILLRDGQEIARHEGGAPPARFRRWLEAAAQ